MAKKYSDKGLQHKKSLNLQSEGRTAPVPPQPPPKLSDAQLQSMSVEELEELDKEFSRKLRNKINQ